VRVGGGGCGVGEQGERERVEGSDGGGRGGSGEGQEGGKGGGGGGEWWGGGVRRGRVVAWLKWGWRSCAGERGDSTNS